MSSSLRSGGAASFGIGLCFLGFLPFSRFDMSFVLQRFWRENASEWQCAQYGGSRFSTMLGFVLRNGGDYVVWGKLVAYASMGPQRKARNRGVTQGESR